MPSKRKDGRWRAHKMIDGERRTKLCDTKDEAKRWEAAQTREAWRAEAPSMTPTAFSWATEYLSYCKDRYVRKTYYHKRAAFKRLLARVGRADVVGSVTPGVALHALQNRARTSGNAANVDRKHLRAGWEWGRKHLEHWPDMPNPFAAVERFPEDRSPRYVPPEADFWRAVGHGCTTDEQRAFLLVLLYTAARLGEVCRLIWGDVDLAGHRIRFSTRKRAGGGLDSDWLPLAAPAVEVLNRLPKRALLVFALPTGEPFQARQHLMKKICARAGVKHFGFHAIRHLSASVLAGENVPLPVIQNILRHKSATTTSKYLKSLGVDLPEINRVWDGRQDRFAQKFAHDNVSQFKPLK